MLILKSVVTLFILSASTVAALAQPAKQNIISLNGVIDTVEKPFRPDNRGMPQLQTVQADFFQRSTLAAKNKEYRAEGTMYLKPATSSESLKFRFEYYRPTRQEITCNGRTLWIYLPENRQVIQSDVAEFFEPSRFNASRTRAVNFLQGLGRISKDFTILFNNPMTDSAGNYILALTPIRASVSIEKLFITVNRNSMLEQSGNLPKSYVPAARPVESQLFPILSTTVVDHDGNSTTMEFTNIRSNYMISDMLFNFIPPPEAQVVRPPTGR